MKISPFAAREGTGAPPWPNIKNVVVTSFRPVTSSSSHTRCRIVTNSLQILQKPSLENLRDGGETTIKIKFSLFEGGGLGGRDENRPKRCFSWETPRQ